MIPQEQAVLAEALSNIFDIDFDEAVQKAAKVIRELADSGYAVGELMP